MTNDRYGDIKHVRPVSVSSVGNLKSNQLANSEDEEGIRKYPLLFDLKKHEGFKTVIQENSEDEEDERERPLLLELRKKYKGFKTIIQEDDKDEENKKENSLLSKLGKNYKEFEYDQLSTISDQSLLSSQNQLAATNGTRGVTKPDRGFKSVDKVLNLQKRDYQGYRVSFILVLFYDN